MVNSILACRPSSLAMPKLCHCHRHLYVVVCTNLAIERGPHIVEDDLLIQKTNTQVNETQENIKVNL